MFRRFYKKHKPSLQDVIGSIEDTPLLKSLDRNLAIFRDIFRDDDSLIIRRFVNRVRGIDQSFCVLYLDGMINSTTVTQIIKPLIHVNLEGIRKNHLAAEIMEGILPSGHILTANRSEMAVKKLLQGYIVVLIDGYGQALVIPSKGYDKRQVGQPKGRTALNGPREGFTETIEDNLMLIRRRINTPHLKARFKTLGRKTKTRICLCYLDDVVNKTILAELERRLDTIEIDSILESGYIEDLIRDEPLSPFPTVGSSERPDVIAGRILEGRVALLINGTPFVLTVPFIIAEITQASEDYYENFFFASFNRLMRTLAPFGAILIPPFYLSVVTYHQEILPTPLYMSLAQARQEVPLPSLLALFLALLLFDLIREVGTRMPAQMGNTISFMGSLILGETLIQARIIGAPIVIVAALSGILVMLNFNMSGAIIVVRTLLLLASAIFGIYGALIAFLLVILHLLNIRSFGVPYLLNVSRLRDHNFQDVWIRSPWWTMTLRPKIIGARNIFRQATGRNRRTR